MTTTSEILSQITEDPQALEKACSSEELKRLERRDPALYVTFLKRLVAKCKQGHSPAGLLLWFVTQREDLEALWGGGEARKSGEGLRERQLRSWLKWLDLYDMLLKARREIQVEARETKARPGASPGVSFRVTFASWTRSYGRGQEEEQRGGESVLSEKHVEDMAREARRGLRSLGVTEPEARDEVGHYPPLSSDPWDNVEEVYT